MKKFTKAMRNIDIIAILNGEQAPNGSIVADLIKHLEHENELLARKNSGDAKKPTKTQQENEGYKAQILEYLSTQTEGVTASAIMTAVGLPSNQKAAALLKALVDAGSVAKTVVKGKSLFALVENGDEG